MEKIICPSCGAEVAVDGSAVYRKADKSAAIDALHAKIGELDEKLRKLSEKKENDNAQDENGGPFSEFEK
jgi:transcription initiation factor IIE alpha subunit